MIACALALSAAIPSFSQTKKDSDPALGQRAEASVETADEAAVAVGPIEAANGPIEECDQQERAKERSGAATIAADEGTHAFSRADARSSSRALEAKVVRDFEAMRARIGVLINARGAAHRITAARVALGLVEAAKASIAPHSVDRGQLLRASLAGNLRASFWLLQYPELLLGHEAAAAYRAALFTPGEPERALRLALYLRLVAQADKSEVLVDLDVLGHVRDDLATGWLDATTAMRALYELEFAYATTQLAREARLARAFLIAEHGQGIPYLEGIAARLFASLLSDPRADIAAEAADALWRLQNLRVGCYAPTLCGNDVHGNELCLGDFRGRLVLVRFWSFYDDGSENMLAQDAFLVEHFWDDPFSILGVNRDADRELYLERHEELGLPGNQVYEGPQSENLLPEILERRAGRPLAYDAWREAGSGTTYLIDWRGVIRAVNPPPNRLPEIIRGFAGEYYLEKRN